MKKIRWGIIGLGNIAKTFALSIQPLENALLIAVASKRPDSLKFFQEKYNISKKFCFENYSELLLCDEIDAVYIALPNHLHMEWIVGCLEQEKHILVEKPAVTSSKQLATIQKKFDYKNLVFSEAFMYLHHPRVQMLIDYINDGRIGKPLGMKSSLGFKYFNEPSLLKRMLNFYKKKPFRLSKKHGGGCILDLGCYLTSLGTLLSKNSDNSKVFSFSLEKSTSTFAKQEVEIDAATVIKFNNGFFSDIRCSFTEHLDQTTRIWGEGGEIILENTWTCQSNGFWHDSEYFQIPSPPLFDNPYSFQVHNLSKIILSKSVGENVHMPFAFQDSLNNAQILDSWRSASKE